MWLPHYVQFLEQQGKLNLQSPAQIGKISVEQGEVGNCQEKKSLSPSPFRTSGERNHYQNPNVMNRNLQERKNYDNYLNRLRNVTKVVDTKPPRLKMVDRRDAVSRVSG